MSERGIEVKVGVLVITCMALLGAFIVLLGDYSTTERGDLFIDVPTTIGRRSRVATAPSMRPTKKNRTTS